MDYLHIKKMKVMLFLQKIAYKYHLQFRCSREKCSVKIYPYWFNAVTYRRIKRPYGCIQDTDDEGLVVCISHAVVNPDTVVILALKPLPSFLK